MVELLWKGAVHGGLSDELRCHLHQVSDSLGSDGVPGTSMSPLFVLGSQRT